MYEQVDIQATPFDAARVNAVLDALQAKADAQMEKDGIPKARRKYGFSLDMRHRGQINEVEVMLDMPRLKGKFEQPLREAFYKRYEQLYGRGSAYRNARLEIVTLRVRATAPTPRPKLSKSTRLTTAIPKAARRASRDIYWTETKKVVRTPIFDGAALVPGNRIAGPCVVETSQTNVVVHPGRTLKVDAYGNFEITFN